MIDQWQRLPDAPKFLEALAETVGAVPGAPSSLAEWLAAQVALAQRARRAGKTPETESAIKAIEKLKETVLEHFDANEDPGPSARATVGQDPRLRTLFSLVPNIRRKLAGTGQEHPGLFDLALAAARYVPPALPADAREANAASIPRQPGDVFLGSLRQVIRFPALTTGGVLWLAAGAYSGVGYRCERHPGDFGPECDADFVSAVAAALAHCGKAVTLGLSWWIEEAPPAAQSEMIAGRSAGAAFQRAFEFLLAVPPAAGAPPEQVRPAWSPAVVVMAAVNPDTGDPQDVDGVKDKIEHLISWNALQPFAQKIDTIATSMAQVDEVIGELKRLGFTSEWLGSGGLGAGDIMTVWGVDKAKAKRCWAGIRPPVVEEGKLRPTQPLI